MANLHTKYLGLDLINPFIVGSCGLTGSISKIEEAEQAGAGAIVLKSLFEEQIIHQADSMMDKSFHSEAMDYLLSYTKSKTVDDYLELIKEAKSKISIPVIASICCTTANDWVEFAKRVEVAGADALEINVFILPTDKQENSSDIENIYFDLAVKIKQTIHIPFAFKIGYYFTNLPHLVYRLDGAKVPGVIMFNRFYEPDIDIDKMEFKSAEVFSSAADIRHSLRWIGITSAMVKDINICASTGVHDGAAAIKQILAGASAVQSVSVFYKKGFDHLSTMISDMEKWMDKHNYKTINDFKGKMNYGHIKNPEIYERAQFMRYFSSIE